jgi:hypothetical protein
MTRVHLCGALGFTALVLCGAQAPSASANDSSVELSIGGLTFTKNADVSMESETLTITPESVTVQYQFLNQSPNPVTLTVGFPLPDIDLSDPDANFAIPAADSVNFVGFRTKVNGAPVTFDIRQRAMVGDKDVTDAIRRAGLPVLPPGGQIDGLKELPAQTKDRLVDQGVLVPSGTDDQGAPRFDLGWTVKTSILRQQTFPPGQQVTVEHQYRTSVGVSFDTVLRKAVREKETMAAEFKRYRTDYCVTDFFLRGIDRRAGTHDENVARLQERRISYVLKTGANWAGPIKNFRLVVDKGKADRLVSFCGDTVKRLTPTTFEMTAKNFTPQRDLKILLITVSE